MAGGKLFLAIVTVSLAALLIGACQSEPAPAPGEEVSPPIQVSEESSQKIAEEFVRNSPTFSFDGMEETLKLTNTLTARCPYCWVFIFEFDSRAAGYGGRTGMMLAQVITHHRSVIAVDQHEIESAVMDEE